MEDKNAKSIIKTFAVCAGAAILIYEVFRYKKNKINNKNLIKINYLYTKEFT